MSRLLARIMLALVMLPLAALLYLVTSMVVMTSLGYGGRAEPTAFMVANILSAGFVVIYWTMLWRRMVRWTSERMAMSVVSGLACAGTGVIVGLLAGSAVSAGFGVFLGGVVSILLWVPSTVLVWQESNSERAERLRKLGSDTVACPTCGYNMTGLRQTTCPECGGTFTIDQLLAGQPSRETAELERS